MTGIYELTFQLQKSCRNKREGGTKSLSQQYIVASEATSNVWNEDVTFSAVLLS